MVATLQDVRAHVAGHRSGSRLEEGYQCLRVDRAMSVTFQICPHMRKRVTGHRHYRVLFYIMIRRAQVWTVNFGLDQS